MTFPIPARSAAAGVRNVLVALAFAIAIAPAQAGATGATATETTAANEAIVRKAFEGWSAGNGNVFDLLSPDVRWTIHGSGPVAGTYNGIQDFTQRASAPLVSRLASTLKPELRHIWASGDMVIIRFDASAITTSGAPYNNQFVWIFRMKDGSVTEAEAFLDLAAYQQVVDKNEPGTR